MFVAAGNATADDAASEIRRALAQWTDDFNAGRTDKVCDLFAVDVRADVRGAAERDHAAICDLLVSSLKDESKHYSYAMDLKEVLVFGDVAVVRLVWTLTIELEKWRQRRIGRAGHGYFPEAERRQLEDHPLHGL